MARDGNLRAAIIAELKAGRSPAEVTAMFAPRGVTNQRVWNIQTYLERLSEQTHNNKRGMRECLACKVSFMSWGPGNRRCRECLRMPDQAGPYEVSFGSHARVRIR